MKFVGKVFVLVLIVQVSLGANDPKAFYKSTKTLVSKIKPMIKAVLKELPNSSAYMEYKKDLEIYLDVVGMESTKKIPCFFKTFGLMNLFVDLIAQYEKENASKEAKEVLAIFNKNGFHELDKEFIKVALDYDLGKLGKDLEKFANSKDNVLSEQC